MILRHHSHSKYLLWLSTLLILGAASDVLAAVDFPAATDRELSSDTPSDIALADFNGDGDLDIAVSMSAAGGAGTAGISVVLSNGSGGFIGDNPFNPGLGAHALAAGDLDGDMSMDLAVVGIFGSGSTPQVRLFLGSGAGAFTAATPSNILSATGFPSAIVVGNFNGDSNPDLAVADSSGGVLVYLGDGTIGTGSGFGAGQAISGSSQSPRDLILNDFDGDGNIDLATPSAVFLGAGDGTFSASAGLGGGKSLAAGDVNRDGILDIIVALNVSGADVLDTWLGAGDGTFTFGTRSNLLATAHIQVKIAVADMDADGMVDVVASDTAGNTIMVLPGQGNGNFGTAQSFATPAFSGPVAIGDWNGDSLPDMAGAYGIVDAAGLSIFFQNQPGPVSAAPGAFRLGSSSYAVSEGVGQVMISVVRTGSSVGATTVDYATTDDTATAPADYTATSGTLNFADGQLVATFAVTILDDTVFESPGTESFTVTLSAPTAGATLGTPSSASVVISENDPAPDPGTLQFSTATYSTAENAANVTITVTRTGGSAGIATANYATANGSATATEDYTAASGTVTFADGSMTSQSFTITLLDDLVYEGDETVSLSLSNVIGATAGSPISATLTITENEIRQPGTLAFSSPTYSVDEHLGPVTVSVSRTGGSDGQVTIQYVTSSGTATQNSDYTGTVGTLTFADGVTTQSFTVAMIDDVVFEGDEDFSVILLNPGGGGVLGTPSTATVTILENDPLPPVNDPPVAANNNYDATEDTPLTIVAPGVLGNDTDPNSDPLTAVLDVGPVNGGLTLNANGSFTYTPNTNFNGSDGFTYHANDGQDDSNIATVSITVGAVNDAPLAADDPGSTAEDTAVTVNVLTNDSDVDGDTITVSAVSQGANGSVTFTGSNVTYTPNTNFNGSDSFTYTITDTLLTATATVTITVGAANDAPIAIDDPASTAEDTPVTVLVLANDSDPDGDTITVSAVTQATNGSVTFTGSDATYTPSADFNGSDSFTYTITDTLLTATATVNVTVNAINDAPIAVNDASNTPEDTPVTVSVLANDSDPDGDSISISLITQGTNGSVSTNGTTVTYTPSTNFNGSDSFTYTITDGNLTATATVSITVGVVNDAPVAVNDSDSTAEDTAVTVNVLTNDSDPDGDTITVSAVTQGTSGSVTFTGSDVTYAPNANFNGNDSFSYTINDGTLSATATVNITVTAANDAPVAVNDSDSTAEDTAVTVNVLTNDSDVDGDTITVSNVSQGGNGAVTFTGSDVTYTPSANFNGGDSFTYTITDSLLTATATVNITVTAANDAPIAVDDPASTDEDTPVTVIVLANDSDPDGDGISVSAVGQGISGSVTTNGTTVTYTPSADFNGNDSFTYTITDGTLPATATVNVSVAAVNDAPIAVDDPVATDEDTAVTLNVLTNDSDVDGDTITISSVSQGTNGSVTFAGSNATYTPNADFNGSDSFIYTITDGSVPATATVTVTVAAVNDAPLAADDPASTSEDTPVTVSVLGNDSDPDGDAITVSGVSQGANGSVTFTANNVTYTPSANFNGGDSFTYTITDGTASATATVSVSVGAINDAPLAVDDPASTSEDTPVTVSVLTNDSDPDGDAITISGVSQGANGSVTFTASSVTYIPSADFNGSDSFTYTITDTLLTATATVSVSVSAANDAPVAVNDVANTPEDTAITVLVLGNDTDPDGDPISVSGVSQGTSGTVTTDGTTVTYLPNTNFNGSDNFTYTITDSLLTATATVSISVGVVNDAPVAVNDNANTAEDTAVTVDVLANDADPDNDTISVSLVSQGTNGVVTFTGTDVTYTPNLNFNGSDSFTYTITDNNLTATASVSITVTAVNDAPVAVDDPATTDEDQPVIIDVLGNDSDVDGGPLSVSAVTQGANGQVTNNGNNLTYTPALNFTGLDSFTYTVTDGTDFTTANVGVEVLAVNDVPVAVPDNATTIQEMSVTIDVLSNDTDDDGDSLSLTVVTQGANGSVQIVANEVVYTPNPNFTGIDTFDYTLTDGNSTASATVTVDVTPPPGGTFSFEFGNYSIIETGWEITVNVIRSGGTQGVVSVDYVSVDGTATAGLDYDPSVGTLAFADGQAGASITIPILDDAEFEGDEEFTMELSNVQGMALLGMPSIATITILEDDPQPTAGQLSLLTSSIDVDENAGFATLNVVRSGGSVGQVTVDYVTVGGTAIAGSDYDHTTGTVVYADGQMGNRQIQVAIIDDGLYEGNEAFTVSLLNAQGGAPLAAPTSAVVNIADDDPAPPAGAFEFVAALHSTAEDSGNLIIEISRAGGSFGTVSVDYQSSDGSATSPQDYTAVGGTVEFLDGEISRTISIPIIDDLDFEGDEDFTLSILNPLGGATLGSLTMTTATILDNESPPPAGVLQFSGSEYTVTEDGINSVVTVTRTGGSFGAVSIDFATSDDSAIAGQDYQDTFGTLMFADGATNQMIVIPLLDDAIYEVTERLQIALTNPQGGAQLGTPAIADVVIQDNETPPPPGAIEFSGAQYSVNENTPIATITVIRSGGSAGQVGVEYSSTGGTATPAADYVAVAGTLIFADGETIKTFDVTIVDDKQFEGDESIIFSLANASGGAGLGGQSIATLMIRDDDIRSPGAVHFSRQAQSVVEGGSITITIVREGGSDGQIAVELNSVDGTARAGSDYNALSVVLQFADGETSKAVTLSSIDDAIVESTENLKLELSNPTGGTTVSIPADATITITDNDRATPPPRRKGGGSVSLWWLCFLIIWSWSRQRRTAAKIDTI